MTGDPTETDHGVVKYLPSSWMDEAIPDPQRDVNDFIHRAEGGTFLLMPKEDAVLDEADQDEFFRETLEPGQIVAFSVHEDYGWHTIEVRDDGTVSATTYPVKANCLCLYGDIDNLADNLDDLVKNGSEDHAPLPPGRYDITAYWWDDAETHFRFVVDADGVGAFERCAGVN